MQKRTLGKTGFEITEIGLGTWQVGGKWGSPFSHDNADKVINTAIDNGINFIRQPGKFDMPPSECGQGSFMKVGNKFFNYGFHIVYLSYYQRQIKHYMSFCKRRIWK